MTQDDVHTEPLFTARVRADASHARHDEEWFTFLDRVDDAACALVREVLNEWFAELPEGKASTAHAELRSRRAPKVEGSFWELYLHAAFRRTPFRISVETVTSATGANVDFVLSQPDDKYSEFSLEATTIGDLPAARARARRLKAAWDVLNEEVASEFFVWLVKIEREGRQTPSGSKLREAVVPWFATLDRAEALRVITSPPRRSSLPERVFDIDDWSFLVRAVPLSDEAVAQADLRPPLIGAEPIETNWGGSTAEIRRGLRRKAAAKYDSLELPYVVALLDLHRFSGGHEDVSSQLFGERAVQLEFQGDEIISTKSIVKPNGYWTPKRNTRVSAVLYARHLSPWSITRVIPQLWINPWAARPLRAEVPWAELLVFDHEGRLERTPPRVRPEQLFGLPGDWPGPLFGG